MFECESYVASYHSTISEGGHAAEAAESRKGCVTHYKGTQRWTFCPEHMSIRCVIVNKNVFSRIDVEQVIRDEVADDAFADASEEEVVVD